MYIFIFGIIGTLISFIFIALSFYSINNFGILNISLSEKISVKFTLKELFFLSIILILTNSNNAYSSKVKTEENTKFLSILFGEGLLNNSVCLIIYMIITSVNIVKEGKILKII